MELTPKELADPEYMQAYVNDQHITIGELAARLAACESDKAKAEARVQALEQERIKYGPICVVCGAMEPCNLQSDPHSPCTFDPTPRELYERCKKLEQENARLREALANIVTHWNTNSSEYREWEQWMNGLIEQAQHALEGG